MKYKIVVPKSFAEQIKKLDKRSKKIIYDKIQLIKENPFRYKSLRASSSRIFRVRIKIRSKESRLIYSVVAPKVIMICLLERKHDYRELEKFLKQIIS